MKIIFSNSTFLHFSIRICVASITSTEGDDSLKFNKLLVTNVVAEKKPTLKKANVCFHSHHEQARIK